MKIEKIKYSDYMSGQRFGDKKQNKSVTGILKKAGTLAAGSLFLLKSPMALAATVDPSTLAVEAGGAVSGAVKSQVIHAFDPLVELMMALSLPIASVIITGSALMILIGLKEKGHSLMFTGAIGYVLMQMTPLFIKILAGVGGAL